MKLQYPVQVVMKIETKVVPSAEIGYLRHFRCEWGGRGSENKEIKFFAFYILSEAADF